MTDEHPPTAHEFEDGEPYVAPRLRRERGKRKRTKRNRAFWLVLGGVALVALVAAVVVPAMRARSVAAQQLDQANVLLRQADGTADVVDRTVSAQLSAQAAPNVPNVAAEILVARRELAQASKLAKDAEPNLTQDQQNRAQLVQAAANARLAMIDSAPEILIASVKAVQAKSLGDRAWHLTAIASDAEVVAARNYSVQVASKVESAAVSMTTIKRQFEDARDLYSQAASAFPDAGFERYTAYVDLRSSEAAQLEAAALRWLSGDKVAGAIAYARYRTESSQAARAAASLPAAPGNATGVAFRRVAGVAADRYARAKKQALQADKALNGP